MPLDVRRTFASDWSEFGPSYMSFIPGFVLIDKRLRTQSCHQSAVESSLPKKRPSVFRKTDFEFRKLLHSSEICIPNYFNDDSSGRVIQERTGPNTNL